LGYEAANNGSDSLGSHKNLRSAGEGVAVSEACADLVATSGVFDDHANSGSEIQAA
jgi:hypothetical protein